MGLALLPHLQKTELPGAAAAALRDLIVTGRLAPGERLIERVVAERLGISRTPVREAFFQLQRERLLAHHPGRGLLVSNLSKDEIAEIYQILAALERAALRHTVIFPAQMRRRLGAASRARDAAGDDIDRLVLADRAWHEAITGFTANQRLLSELSSPRDIAERYERAFFRHVPDRKSRSEHSEIEAAVGAGRFDAAADLLEAHWLGNIDAMIAVVAARKEGRNS